MPYGIRQLFFFVLSIISAQIIVTLCYSIFQIGNPIALNLGASPSFGFSHFTSTEISISNGSTFYIAPNGSDSNPGTSEQPWQTWPYAIKQLNPGDTLIAKNGTWTNSSSCSGLSTPCLANTTLPKMICSLDRGRGNANNGTATQRIIVKAENERQAWLKSKGSTAGFHMRNCDYWNIEGLRASSADLESANGGTQYGSPFLVEHSGNINLRRLLATHNNRYFNNHAISVNWSTNVLLEESEAYYFHRHGISIFDGSNNTVRRSYANSRGYDNISGVENSIPGRGDEGIIFYTASHNLAENNISEGNREIGVHNGINNRFYGNINIDSSNYAFSASSRSAVNPARDHIFENNIALGAPKGFSSNGGVNIRFDNSSAISGSIGMKSQSKGGGISQPFVPNASAFGDNFLAIHNRIRGLYVVDDLGGGWQSDYVNSYNNNDNFDPDDFTCPDCFSNATQTNPQMYNPSTGQGCIVYVPAGSPMKGAGKNGADIGANIIYRYENGVLTNKKLWDQSTGQFPCGAVVQGVNDDSTFPNSSCVNVHKRLNVGINGCPIP